MHRLELYDRLGVRRPQTQDEDKQAGKAVNRLRAFGEPVPLEWRAEPKPDANGGVAPPEDDATSHP